MYLPPEARCRSPQPVGAALPQKIPDLWKQQIGSERAGDFAKTNGGDDPELGLILLESVMWYRVSDGEEADCGGRDG